ncbi:MAG TPA: hypothetical protein VE262_15790 [Blastocatellia bacterium]|nr:hypothetical protein [Blastocatellia bacterium]
MTIAEAISAFLARARGRDAESDDLTTHLLAPLNLLAGFLSDKGITALIDVTPPVLRDFISRWYVEEATLSSRTEGLLYAAPEVSNAVSGHLPEPREFLRVLEAFFRWAGAHAETARPEELLGVVSGLGPTMPRAVEIGKALSRHVIERGGAFSFPEFLTSFEEGGQSQYDIDAPGDIGALESYFRITRVDGALIEAEDVITGERVWPVLFPEAVARLVDPGFIINLELVRSPRLWRIADCGFTYPPGTEI